MRLLLINPNTTDAITQKVAAAARLAMPDVEVVAATGRIGPRYISGRAGFAIAGHATLDCFAEYGDGADAVLLACFGDPGLEALREITPIPVVGLLDAATIQAATGGQRFGIVTGGVRWVPILEEMVSLIKHEGIFAGVRAVTPTGGAISEDPDAATNALYDACRTCIEVDNADVVILGGAGLIGLAEKIQPRLSKPVICSVEAGFRAAKAALATRIARSPSKVPLEPTASIGLSPALTRLLGG
jgi:allantoin racemase